jgi:hypothetical protein
MRVFSADNSSEQYEEQLEDTVIEKGECKCNRSVRTAGHSSVISNNQLFFKIISHLQRYGQYQRSIHFACIGNIWRNSWTDFRKLVIICTLCKMSHLYYQQWVSHELNDVKINRRGYFSSVRWLVIISHTSVDLQGMIEEFITVSATCGPKVERKELKSWPTFPNTACPCKEQPLLTVGNSSILEG